MYIVIKLHETRPLMTYGSLHMNVIYIITELQSWGHHYRLKISVQNIEVEKWHFSLHCQGSIIVYFCIYTAQ